MMQNLTGWSRSSGNSSCFHYSDYTLDLLIDLCFFKVECSLVLTIYSQMKEVN